MSTRNSLVRVFNDHVEKYTTEPHEMGRKYSAIERIGRLCGFVAPKVLAIKEDRIVLERLHDIRPLHHLYVSNKHSDLDTAIRRAGEVLGYLHRELPAESAVPWVPSLAFDADVRRYSNFVARLSSLPETVLHCDYSFANVFVQRSPRVIAVIDPCPNFASTYEIWTRGPVYLDIGKMLSCLEGQVPARHQLLRPSRSRIDDLQHRFIGAYVSTAPAATLEPEVAHAFAFATASAQFKRRFGLLGIMRRAALYSRVRGNYPAHQKMALWPEDTK